MKKKRKKERRRKERGRKVIVKIFVSRSKVDVVTPLQKRGIPPPFLFIRQKCEGLQHPAASQAEKRMKERRMGERRGEKKIQLERMAITCRRSRTIGGIIINEIAYL